MSRFLVAVILAAYSSVAIAEQPCGPGTQRYDGGCVSDKMVSFIICLKNTTHGRITSVSSDTKSEKKGVYVDVKGAGGNLMVKGDGRVRIDVPNENASMKQIAEMFDPQVSRQCMNIAMGEQPEPRRPTSKRSAKEPAKPVQSATPPPTSPEAARRELPPSAAEQLLNADGRSPAAMRARLQDRSSELAGGLLVRLTSRAMMPLAS